MLDINAFVQIAWTLTSLLLSIAILIKPGPLDRRHHAPADADASDGPTATPSASPPPVAAAPDPPLAAQPSSCLRALGELVREVRRSSDGVHGAVARIDVLAGLPRQLHAVEASARETGEARRAEAEARRRVRQLEAQVAVDRHAERRLARVEAQLRAREAADDDVRDRLARAEAWRRSGVDQSMQAGDEAVGEARAEQQNMRGLGMTARQDLAKAPGERERMAQELEHTRRELTNALAKVGELETWKVDATNEYHRVVGKYTESKLAREQLEEDRELHSKLVASRDETKTLQQQLDSLQKTHDALLEATRSPSSTTHSPVDKLALESAPPQKIKREQGKPGADEFDAKNFLGKFDSTTFALPKTEDNDTQVATRIPKAAPSGAGVQEGDTRPATEASSPAGHEDFSQASKGYVFNAAGVFPTAKVTQTTPMPPTVRAYAEDVPGKASSGQSPTPSPGAGPANKTCEPTPSAAETAPPAVATSGLESSHGTVVSAPSRRPSPAPQPVSRHHDTAAPQLEKDVSRQARADDDDDDDAGRRRAQPAAPTPPRTRYSAAYFEAWRGHITAGTHAGRFARALLELDDADEARDAADGGWVARVRAREVDMEASDFLRDDTPPAPAPPYGARDVVAMASVFFRHVVWPEFRLDYGAAVDEDEFPVGWGAFEGELRAYMAEHPADAPGDEG